MTDRDRLAERHMGLVHSLCRRFSGKGVEYDELFAAGCLGLSKALSRFDESRGLQFSTYAFPVILGEIKRLFRDGGTVKVSRSLRELSLKISRLNGECGELSVSQLAERLGVNEEKIAEAVGSARAPLSLTAVYEGEEGSQTDLPSPDIQYEISDRLSLRQALDGLDGRDRKLINLRYFCGKTQTETAKELSMTQVQVSRREKKILSLLRAQMAG